MRPDRLDPAAGHIDDAQSSRSDPPAEHHIQFFFPANDGFTAVVKNGEEIRERKPAVCRRITRNQAGHIENQHAIGGLIKTAQNC